MTINRGDITTDKWNIRPSLEADKRVGDRWTEFLESIRQHGIQTPITARYALDDVTGKPIPGKYVLLDGMQRISAADKLGITQIPISLNTHPDFSNPKLATSRAMILQFQLNDKRFANSPTQEYQHLVKFMDLNPQMTQQEVAEVFGRSQGWVSQRLKIRNESPLVHAALEQGDLPLRIGQLIATLPTAESQNEWLQKWNAATPEERALFDAEVKTAGAAIRKELRAAAGEEDAGDEPEVRSKAEIEQAWEEIRSNNSDPRYAGLQWAVQLDPVSIAMRQGDAKLRELKKEEAKTRRSLEKAAKDKERYEELQRQIKQREAQVRNAPAEITA